MVGGDNREQSETGGNKRRGEVKREAKRAGSRAPGRQIRADLCANS